MEATQKTYEVVVTGILDETLAEAFADHLRSGNLPDSLAVEIREVGPVRITGTAAFEQKVP